jgi:hypothetical protein
VDLKSLVVACNAVVVVTAVLLMLMRDVGACLLELLMLLLYHHHHHLLNLYHWSAFPASSNYQLRARLLTLLLLLPFFYWVQA